MPCTQKKEKKNYHNVPRNTRERQECKDRIDALSQIRKNQLLISKSYPEERHLSTMTALNTMHQIRNCVTIALRLSLTHNGFETSCSNALQEIIIIATQLKVEK